MIKHYSYSFNRESFEGEYDSYQEALHNALRDRCAELGRKIYIGENVEKTFSEYFDVDSLLEELNIKATDDVGECAEDWLSDVSEENKKELENLLTEWANKNYLQPSFWGIENVKEFTVTQELLNENGLSYSKVDL